MTRVRDDIRTDVARRSIAPRPAPRRRLHLDDTVAYGWVVAATVAWPVLFGIGWILEPEAANPNAVPGPIEGLVVLGFLACVVWMARGFSLQQRFGFAGSFGAAVVLLGMVVACPLTGHHAIGGWWYGQLAATGGLIALSAAGLWGAKGARR
jgi:hypothetical protein